MNRLRKSIFSIYQQIKKRITKRKVGMLLLFLIFFSFMYHNDSVYDYYEEKINPTITNKLGKDPLAWLNNRLHKVDAIGMIKKINHPIHDTDYVDIQISNSEHQELINNLKNVPYEYVWDKNKWVKIKIAHSNKLVKAKMKFHGSHKAHYNDGKYSYSIKLKKEGPFIHNYRRFKLIKGEEADPTIIAINKLADSIGLISTHGQMKILRINDEEKGDYYLVEEIRKEFLERNFGITNFTFINSTSDWTRKEPGHATESDLFFGHVDQEENPLHPHALNQFKLLEKYIESNDVENVVEMFDVEYMGKYLALAAIFNDIHFMSGDNLKMIYDFNRGKFYPIYRAEKKGKALNPNYNNLFLNFNKILFQSYGKMFLKSKTSKLFKTLLSSNLIRGVRDKNLYSFLKNEQKITRSISDTHSKNEHIMLRSGRSRRVYDRSKNKQLSIVSTMFNLSKDYLNYGHIYGSYDTEKKELHLFQDAFVPVQIYYKKRKINHQDTYGLELNQHLKIVNRYHKYKIKESDFDPKKLVFINSLTKDTITHVHLNYINTTDEPDSRSTLQMLNDNHIRYKLNNNTISISPGIYKISSNIIISKQYTFNVPGGVHFQLAPHINFIVNGNISIRGTKQQSVIIENAQKNIPFGSFAIHGKNSDSYANIDYLYVSGGSETYYSGKMYTGQFAIYNSNVNITNSTFKNSQGDDGINIKYSKVYIDHCTLENNKADQIDLDFCHAIVSNCVFRPSQIDPNGDGLDLSGSYGEIKYCNFSGFLDKSLSLGEKSKVLVHHCDFNNNNNALAVKDQTLLYSWSNHFSENTKDYFTFIKKKIFNSPVLYLNESNNNLKMELLSKKDLHSLSLKDQKKELNKFKSSHKNYRLNVSVSNKSLF